MFWYFLISVSLLLICYEIDSRAVLKLTEDEVVVVTTVCILWPIVLVFIIGVIGFSIVMGIVRTGLSLYIRK